MSAESVGIGIVGGGLMGREIAAAIQRWPALIDHPARPRLAAVCDINPAALTWFEQIDTVTQLTTQYAELLANPDVDVVYVAVRHDLHEQMYTDVIRSGKDLLAEKPFGIDRAAASAILQALEEHPESFVRCSSEMPFFPGAQRAIDYVRSGAVGQIIEARSAFLHSSDLDESKPINWKRQAKYCGAAGVMNDLGMHAWHVPLRLGWEPESLTAVLQNLVPQRPGAAGELEVCDTWENATVWGDVATSSGRFPLTVETKRIAPGNKNTWVFEVIGKTGGVRFATSNPKRIEVLTIDDVPGIGREQGWTALEAGSQSVWPTVTGGIFETGFSDAILQMWAAYLAERVGELGDRFGAATPQEAARTHSLYDAALASAESGRWTQVG
ncbi:MAG: Gfo/Idh/MocA family oxidoreductase [Microbacterium sp.]|jgi:predicted dehydrogenase|uniref:Gfo/Idh/MocA family protein n=1 Tax=Microbacterium sp. TaxID=51671 RepID=UPI00281CDF2C|nr:Gfo/Idh/MocA family oxidoreductase [Microbacterium sp.]MDR2323570.1 Gfo/Idh/MocA family oxidoreductase [Microbacterium sp.]